MRYRGKIRKIALAIPLVMTLTFIASAPAYAGWGWGHDRGHHRHYDRGHRHHHYGRSVVVLPSHSISIVIGGGRFYYGEGHFYRRHSHREYVVVPAPIGATIYSLPGGCSRVVIRGVPYYMYEGVYYRQYGRGYRVVESPIENEGPELAIAAASTKPQDSFTINIPNANSGYTAVTLKRSGNGFVGPQGEYYPEFPQVEQLRTIYGK
jgi:hypothetical protein